MAGTVAEIKPLEAFAFRGAALVVGAGRNTHDLSGLRAVAVGDGNTTTCETRNDKLINYVPFFATDRLGV